MQEFALSTESQLIAGVVLLSIVGIEFGGWFLTRLMRGEFELTSFQRASARAGHAHAGSLVTLSLVTLVLADAASLGGTFGWVARIAVPLAAALISAGFFFSSMGKGLTRPNGWIVLVWLGAVSLGIGVVTLGVGLLAAA